MVSLKEIDVAILCGGLGTRLRPVIGETAKVMARIGGRPFLEILTDQLAGQGFPKCILLSGFRADMIRNHFSTYDKMRIIFSEETEPLGTAGALRHAQTLFESDPFMVLNGDSYLALDFERFLRFHESSRALATVAAAKPQGRADGGLMEAARDGRILRFTEKDALAAGYLNAGVYCFCREVLEKIPQGTPFSLERDLFPALIPGGIYAYLTENTVHDIGTPERLADFRRAYGPGEPA
jgi:NDP-sugar pyrophosphorylase family protein